MVAEIIQLTSLDDEDEAFIEFLDSLKGGNTRGVFILEREDGRVAVGSNASERSELIYDLYRLQKLIEQMVFNE